MIYWIIAVIIIIYIANSIGSKSNQNTDTERSKHYSNDSEIKVTTQENIGNSQNNVNQYEIYNIDSNGRLITKQSTLNEVISLHNKGLVFRVDGRLFENRKLVDMIYFEANALCFRWITKKGYLINISTFPELEFEKILLNHGNLLTDSHVRGNSATYPNPTFHYSSHHSKFWFGGTDEKLIQHIEKFVKVFKINEDVLFKMKKSFLIELLSVIPIVDYEWFISIKDKIPLEYIEQVITKMYDGMIESAYQDRYGNGCGGNYYKIEDIRRRCVLAFDPQIVVRVLYKSNHLFAAYYRNKEGIYTREVLDEIYRQYPKEMWKISNEICIDDDLIVKVLEQDMGLIGKTKLDNISNETGAKLMQMSKFGFVFELVPIHVLEANKDLVKSLILERPERIKHINNKSISALIESWL